MEENYYALAVSILTNCIPETAFRKLESSKPSITKNHYTDQDIQDMCILKFEQGLTYEELANIYCVKASTICKNLKKLRGRLERNL